MKNIMIVFGTRPEAIKMAPLIKEFQKFPQIFNLTVCVSGQHREMLDQVLNIFEIKPEYDLNIMKKGQDLYDIFSKTVLGMKEIILGVKPSLLFVHGDTITSTASALAAFYQQVPVAHVEAGLRTNNIYSPWPEEMNRQITGRLATFHFAPTQLAKRNLLTENVNNENIIITGNTVVDALKSTISKINSDKNINNWIKENLEEFGYNVSRLANSRKLVLITGHRRENFGQGFVNICKSIKALSIKYPDVDFVYPVHLNPNVQKPVTEILQASGQAKNIFLIKPLEYLSFIYLMYNSYLILTDSGGIQEEAAGIGKPVLVMRDVTERTEAVEAGYVKLVGTNSEKIFNSVSILLENNEEYKKMVIAENPYGDGTASRKIVEYIKNNLSKI